MCQQHEQHVRTPPQVCAGLDHERGEDDRDRDAHALPRAKRAGTEIVPDDEPATAPDPRDRRMELTCNG
jgi:hypothetical protein